MESPHLEQALNWGPLATTRSLVCPLNYVPPTSLQMGPIAFNGPSSFSSRAGKGLFLVKQLFPILVGELTPPPPCQAEARVPVL